LDGPPLRDGVPRHVKAALRLVCECVPERQAAFAEPSRHSRRLQELRQALAADPGGTFQAIISQEVAMKHTYCYDCLTSKILLS